jgi:hypothetical protein
MPAAPRIKTCTDIPFHASTIAAAIRGLLLWGPQPAPGRAAAQPRAVITWLWVVVVERDHLS